jgi:hypothetical protein
MNLNTARALGLTVPLIMQVTVDEMIEASVASTLTLLHLLTAGFGPEPTLLERKLTSASGSAVDLMPTGGHFGF